jgi:hypothetical protein
VIQGKVFEALAPMNLRANAEIKNPAYSHGQDMLIEWTLSEAGRDYYQKGLLKLVTVIRFLNVALVELGTRTLAEGVASLALSNADLITLLGGEITFVVEAKTQITASEFILYSSAVQLKVLKI